MQRFEMSRTSCTKLYKAVPDTSVAAGSFPSESDLI